MSKYQQFMTCLLEPKHVLGLTPSVSERLQYPVTKIRRYLFYNSKFVEEGNKDTFKYDIKAKAGDVAIFNELGYHRGSSPTKNDRYALRYHYLRQSHDMNWYKKIKR